MTIKSFELTPAAIKRFEKAIAKINSNDALEVRTKIGKKLSELQAAIKNKKYIPKGVIDLIGNVNLLYEMLVNPEYTLSGRSKRWIIFALLYFINPYDIIPDFFPIIGYMDDVAVILWVMDILEAEIRRYKSFLKAKRAIQQGGHIIRLCRRSAESQIILIPGFCSKPWQVQSHKTWINSISKKNQINSISVFVWDTKEFSDLVATLMKYKGFHPIKIPYLIDNALGIWNDAKINAALYSHVLAKDLDAMLRKNKRKQTITLVGHSLGARLIYESLKIMDKNMVQVVYTLGGAVGNRSSWPCRLMKIQHQLINCYSIRDTVLKYIYRFAERNESPIGLKRIAKNDSSKRTEIDCTQCIVNHNKYANNAEFWLQ